MRVVLLKEREGEELGGCSQVTDRRLGKKLHRVEDIQLLRHLGEAAIIQLGAVCLQVEEPVSVLSEAYPPVQPMEEDMDEDVEGIELSGERVYLDALAQRHAL